MTRLNDIKARLAAAADGPWFVEDNPGDPALLAITQKPGQHPDNICTTNGWFAEKDWDDEDPDDPAYWAQDRANAIFIAHAPEDIGWLLERVERLEGVLDQMAGEEEAGQIRAALEAEDET